MRPSAAAKEIAIYISSSAESQNESDSNISVSDTEKNDDNSSK